MSPLFHMIAGAPTPVAPFSHAVETDGWMFVTGQMPTDPDDDGARCRMASRRKPAG